MQKRFTILTAQEEQINQLYQVLKIHPAICKILIQRGIDSFEKAKSYFRPQLKDLHDPWLMKDMQKAVDRILIALTENEKILVFGDYDVDGTTSVACMYQFLLAQTKAELIDFYIPHRYREGYGISKQGIDFAAVNNFNFQIIAVTQSL